jgi:hypothetical protein
VPCAPDVPNMVQKIVLTVCTIQLRPCGHAVPDGPEPVTTPKSRTATVPHTNLPVSSSCVPAVRRAQASQRGQAAPRRPRHTHPRSPKTACQCDHKTHIQHSRSHFKFAALARRQGGFGRCKQLQLNFKLYLGMYSSTLCGLERWPWRWPVINTLFRAYKRVKRTTLKLE